MRAAGGTVAGVAPALPLAVFFTGAYVLPVCILVMVSFLSALRGGSWTLEHYTTFLGDWYPLSILLDTLVLGLQVTATTLLIAYPLGLLYLRA